MAARREEASRLKATNDATARMLEELGAAAAQQKKKEAAATVRMIGPLVFMIVTGGQLLNQSRPILVNAINHGNTILSANMLSRFAALGGAAEFLLNPVIGRMSDRFGRRPMLLTSPITCALLLSRSDSLWLSLPLSLGLFLTLSDSDSL